MIWVGVVVLLVGVCINMVISDTHPGVYFGTILACIGVLILNDAKTKDIPSAMDVYQGKTTLEITYKDGVAIDSVVVFKNDNK